ncbi:MAG TPA: isochorismate synthase [Streptosporangiaceae bacterium]|nr:isochorismate synthase [Streptosporangiaceae bacterium]
MGDQHADAGQLAPDRLLVRSVRVADPGDLVAALPQPAVVAWLHGEDGLAGWGEAARLTLPAGADRFTAAEKWLRELFEGADIDDQVRAPGSGPVAFGSFTFDPVSDGSVLVIPRALLARRAGQCWLTTITGPRVAAGTGAAGQPREPVIAPAELRWSDGSLSAPQWEHAVSRAVARIRAGAQRPGTLRKVVLARDLHAVASAPIDARMLLARLAARAPDSYVFACAGLTGATPELLVRRERSEVSSLVLAGTVPRGGTPAQDAALGAALMASAKEAEEHRYAVESVLEVLGPLSDDLQVAPAPALLTLADLQHLATPVRGTLAVDRSALALAAALHPTAAVCGTPTEPAMELIRELEGMDRGRYAGPVGWIDSRGNGEWGIALRCGELDGPRARLFAGGGIVADSDPAAELAETQTKFRVMRRALDG